MVLNMMNHFSAVWTIRKRCTSLAFCSSSHVSIAVSTRLSRFSVFLLFVGLVSPLLSCFCSYLVKMYALSCFFLLFVDCVLFCAYYPLLIELQRYISGRNLVDDAHIRPHSFLIRLFPLFNLFQVWRPLFCQPVFLLLPVLSTPFHSSQWRLRITCSPPAWRIRAGPATSWFLTALWSVRGVGGRRGRS